MLQAIGLTHDLGHPPFGHGGEVALNYCMRNNGGFEGNGHTLRILARKETFSKKDGSDLTRRSLLGVLKYPAPYSKVRNPALEARLDESRTSIRVIDRKASKPPKCYLDTENDVVDWILQPLSDADRDLFQTVKPREGEHGKPIHKSFDCSIMDLADDIAYGVHDLEDAIALGLISPQEFKAHVTDDHCASFLDYLKRKYPDESANDVYGAFVRSLFGSGDQRKHFINRMVAHLMMNISIVTIDGFAEPLLRYRVEMDSRCPSSCRR
jgi:dGTPase